MEEIIKLLNDRGLTRMGFGHNVEIESTFDEDGDEFVTIVNAVEMTPDGLVAYDSNDECQDGSYDPVWKLSELSEDIRAEILWALENHPWDVWNWEPYK